MKQKLFVGSSSEALAIANAIQENLSYDAEVTVWNQGVFKLSSTSLNDLVTAVGLSDFAIFVFNPDDISVIREQTLSTTRDNVIFELGLFIGKLGQKNVFYVIPENEKIHLPTDLLGINPGKYNNQRSDRNLLAALGPFCNQVRAELKRFQYINLRELDGESDLAKTLVVDKPSGFELLLLAELIEPRLNKVSALLEKLRAGTYFVRSAIVDDKAYYKFFQETLEDFQRMVKVVVHLINQGLKDALGPNGVPTKVGDLKEVADQLAEISIELFNWESRNEQLTPPQELANVKMYLRGTSEIVLSQINRLPSEIRRVARANQNPNGAPNDFIINLTLDEPKQVELAFDELRKYFQNKYP